MLPFSSWPFTLICQPCKTYSHPLLLWGVCLVLLYWISRMVMIAHRGNMDDDPIVFAVGDRTSRICGLLIAGIGVAGSLA